MATVLIVDDEPLVLRLLARVLCEAGYETIACEGGKAALKVITEYPDAVSCVLTDIQMRHVNGLCVAEAFKHRWPNAAVVFMSAASDRGLDGEPLLAPGDRFLQKPFNIPVLLATVGLAHRCESMRVA